VGGVKFDKFALINGTAELGVRWFTPRSPTVPAFTGLIGAIDLSYIALGTIKLGMQANRDVQYSFEINQPYYVQSGAGASLDKHVTGPIDFLARVSVQRLTYRDRVGVDLAAPRRSDYIHTRGASLSYRTGRDLRVAFNVDHQKRTSVFEQRQYSGLRYGTSIIYGF